MAVLHSARPQGWDDAVVFILGLNALHMFPAAWCRLPVMLRSVTVPVLVPFWSPDGGYGLDLVLIADLVCSQRQPGLGTAASRAGNPPE